MTRLLYIEASPAGLSSTSGTVARAFLEAWREKYPEGQADTLNLWTTGMPELDRNFLSAREGIETGRPLTRNESIAWNSVREMAYRFLAADRVLLSSPMWNFGLPYRLKHYIDCLTQPTLTYTGNPEQGFQGKDPGRPAVLILSRGGSYRAGSGREPFDFQRRYLLAWLEFLGLNPVETILVEPTTGPPAQVRSVLAAATATARSVASK